MKKTSVLLSVLFLGFLLCTPIQAQPPMGMWDSGEGDFVAGNWREKLWGMGEGQLGNEIEADSSDYALDAAFLDTVTLVTSPSPPDVNYYEYETYYVGGTLLLFNIDGLPWYNSDDPNAVFIVDLDPTKVMTKKFVDEGENPTGDIEFMLTAAGKFRHYPDLFADIEAYYTGMPDFDDSGFPVMMSGELAWGKITIRGPIPLGVYLDIKPGSCPNPLNLKSKGVLPAAVLGTGDFDVRNIDPATLTLNGVSPLRWSYEDVATPPDEPYECTDLGPDGYEDLTLKFETVEIVESLVEVEDGNMVVLELEAYLKDGTEIRGQDVVVILKKGKMPWMAWWLYTHLYGE